MRRGRPRGMLFAAFAAVSLPWAGGVAAADLDAAALADLRRAVAAVGLSTSDQPALRVERGIREPSRAFMLGAAQAAWTNAAAQLAFDLANPTAAGPPHASQTGDLAQFLTDDCREEATAFAALQAGMRQLGLSAAQLAAAAGADQAAIAVREANPPAACQRVTTSN